jgi:uncharacterized membrane protein/DNA-directed RNA polymerase subunit RPC12/RpoP
MREILQVTVGVILLLLSVCFSFGAAAQIEVTDNYENLDDVGDFIEVSFWTDEDDIEMSGNLRMELTCDETVRVHGKSYDCHVINVKGNGDFDSGLGIKGSWDVTGKQFSDKSDGSSVKSELLLEMTMTYQGETYTMTSDMTTERLSWSTNWTGQGDPVIGDCWKETCQEKSVSRNTAETPEGTETTTDTDTDTDVTINTYVGDENVNSKLGNIECRVIQSYDEDDMYYKDEDYVLNYIDKELNIPVKYETYEDGDPVLTMETVAYKIGSDKAGTEVIGPIGGVEDDKGLFGLGKIAGFDISLILIIVALVAIVLIIAVFMMTRGHSQPETPAGAQYPTQQPSAPQPPSRPSYMPPPPRLQTAPSQMNAYNCPHCGKPFSAQPSYQVQQLSCPSCSGRVTINPQQPRVPAPKPSPAPPQQSRKQAPPKQPQRPVQQSRASAPKLIPLTVKQPQKQEPPAQQPPQEEPKTEQPEQESPVQEPPQDEPKPEQPTQGSLAEQPSQEEPEPEQSVQEPPQDEPKSEPPTQEPEEQLKEQPTQPSKQPETVRESPMDILKLRLAKGEIDLETFRELKKEIE